MDRRNESEELPEEDSDLSSIDKVIEVIEKERCSFTSED